MLRFGLLALAGLLFLPLIATTPLADYQFATLSETYSEISTGTLLGNSGNDDERFVAPSSPGGGTITTGPGFPIGFEFSFAGESFDRLAVNTNGWIALGQSALGNAAVNISSSSHYSPLESTVSISPDILVSRIAALARDLQANPGASLLLSTTGSAPNRHCLVQWKHYRKKGSTGSGDSFNFQIRLHETSNIIDFVYGTMTNNANSATIRIGLRGAPSSAASNYVNRTGGGNWLETIAGSSAGTTYTLSSTNFPPSGTVFRYSPPKAVTVLDMVEPIITELEGQIELAWQPVSGANSYQIYVSDLPDDGFVYLLSTGNLQVYLSTGARQRFYRVIASTETLP